MLDPSKTLLLSRGDQPPIKNKRGIGIVAQDAPNAKHSGWSKGRFRSNTININDQANLSGNNDTLVTNPLLNNLLTGSLNKIALPAAISDATHPPLTLYFDNNSMDDLWLAITWGK